MLSKFTIKFLSQCLVLFVPFIFWPLQAETQSENLVTIHLFTENFPPISMIVDASKNSSDPDNITGISSLIIKELFNRAKIDYTLELVPWKRAYESALLNADTGVFSATRTEEREDLFRWVSPLIQNNWVLMGRVDSGIVLNSLEEASQYRIGGYLGDAIAGYLEGEGLFIRYVSNDVLNVRKLARNRIDLWPVVRLKGHWLARSEGESVEELFIIKSTVAGLALNKNVDVSVVKRLQSVLDEMHRDGTIKSIKQKFLFQ